MYDCSQQDHGPVPSTQYAIPTHKESATTTKNRTFQDTCVRIIIMKEMRAHVDAADRRAAAAYIYV